MLAAIVGGATVKAAARAAGLSSSAVHQLAYRSPAFAERLAEAQRSRDPSTRWPAWARPFLAAVADGAPVTEAAQAFGITYAAAYLLGRRCPAFAAALAEARKPAQEVRLPARVEVPALSVDEGDGGPVALLVDLVRIAWADAAAGDVEAQAWLAELLGRPVSSREAAERAASALRQARRRARVEPRAAPHTLQAA